jgi:hypothetical protein
VKKSWRETVKKHGGILSLSENSLTSPHHSGKNPGYFERKYYNFHSDIWLMEMVKEFHHLLRSPVFHSGENKKTPVEERGYKNFFNLPDWPIKP